MPSEVNIAKACSRDKLALARLVTALEDGRPQTLVDRAAMIDALADKPCAPVLGITGPPGVGKSTLVSALLKPLRERIGTIGIVAVDPSSKVSGGSILGDRTRVELPDATTDYFFRSQPSSNLLGGLAPSTFLVSLAFAKIFDLVIIETVGVGQSETDIREYADCVMVLANPLAGDDVQAIKAGIMEIPDLLAVTKADAANAKQTRAMLARQRPDMPVLAISALRGEGMPALIDEIDNQLRRASGTIADKAQHFLRRWVHEEYGKSGLRKLDALGGAQKCLETQRFVGAALVSLQAALE